MSLHPALSFTILSLGVKFRLKTSGNIGPYLPAETSKFVCFSTYDVFLSVLETVVIVLHIASVVSPWPSC